ncbi:MAG: hypothetical protein ACLQMS_03390 [Desulfomonilaceae bacterium]
MKKLWFGLLATLLLTIFVVPAFAWEWQMTGQFEWRFRYFNRAGGYADLFGDQRFQDSPLNTTGQLIGFAGPNYYRGYNGQAFNAATLGAPNPMTTNRDSAALNIVKGGWSFADCDAYAHDQRMTFSPVLRVNNAIAFYMNMDLASIRNKYNHRDYQTNGILDRWYQDRTSANAFDTAMIPSINQYRLAVQLPWGIMSVGAKDFPLGTGSFLGYNTRASALLFSLPYGPFRIIPAIWLARYPDAWATGFTPYAQVLGTQPTSPNPNTVVAYDGGLHATTFWGLLFTYQNGPVDIGGGLVGQVLWHIGQANGQNSGAPNRAVLYGAGQNQISTTFHFATRDMALAVYQTYAKYNNGRFFANVEYDWGNQDLYYIGQAAGSGAGFPNSGGPALYLEGSQFFSEIGALCGPAKLAFMFAWSGGTCLNNNNPTKRFVGLPIDNQATDAYNYLMFHTYAGGNNGGWSNANAINFTPAEDGQMLDAYALAARLDYAVAANLNVWGSYMWASRVEENGFYAGGTNYNGTAGNTNQVNAQLWKQLVMPGAGAAANMNPFVDDNNLGWEAQLGVDWKLLENMSVLSRYAYWQPGPWFDQAYAVVGNSNGVTYPNGTEGVGAVGAYMQGRSAIQAFTTSVMIDF